MTFFCMRLIILFIVITFWLSGCWTNTPYKQEKLIVTDTNPTERLVSIQQKTSTPCLENCTSIHVWYARAQYDNLFWTASHVLPANFDQILIQWKWVCWIKQVWNHPTQDLSLIQTVWTCIVWIGSGSIASWTNNQWILLKSNTTQSVSVTENEWLLFASWLLLEPWMSGSPLVSSQWALIWLVHAQTKWWTMFIDVTQWWEDLLSLSEK